MFGQTRSRDYVRQTVTRTLALALAAAAPMAAAPLATPAALAQDLDDGSKARINHSSKIAMLAQTMAGAACRASAGVDADAARRTLADAKVEMQSILDGLEHGNKALGIPTPERRSRTIRALRSVRAAWEPMAAAVDRVVAGEAVDDAAATVIASTQPLEDAANILKSEISAYYANPNELLFVDAIAIDMAARQRLLSQKIAAKTCLLARGGNHAEALSDTASLFEKTLIALRDGFPEVGVRKPPNDAVMNKITATWDTWADRRARIDRLVAARQADGATIADVAAGADRLQKDMNDLVILYILSTPGRDGAIRDVLREMATSELVKWVEDPEVIEAVRAQNARHAGLSEEAVIALDQQWRAEEAGSGGPLIDELMSRPLSRKLLDKQVATAGFINEIFVMDDKGLNVAQSAVTSDYWQGDEDKWQQSYGTNDIHISEVEFDDSTGVFQSQVSIPVTDPASGEPLGAITFGVNVQLLL